MDQTSTPTQRERTGRRRLIIIVLFGTLALVVLGVVAYQQRPEPQLRFTVLDVGQGDAIFIEAPTGEQMLIDGGPSNVVLEKLGRAMPMFDRTIDVVVLTHPDADHLSGLVAVLERYQVGALLVSGASKDTATYEAFARVSAEKNLQTELARAGDVLSLSGDVSFHMLFPDDAWMAEERDPNDTSIIGRLVYRDFSILLPGDASDLEEHALLAHNTTLDSDILKVGHHGSRSSTSAAFLQAANPQLAFISVGANNSYGHPTPEVLSRLQQAGVASYRTDLGGDILLTSDGTGYTISRGLGFRLW